MDHYFNSPIVSRFGSYQLVLDQRETSAYTLAQFHSPVIHSGLTIIHSPTTLAGDGIYCTKEEIAQLKSIQQNIVFEIKTADCLAVLIEGDNGFAFIHAGWKGLQQKILIQNEVIAIKPKIAYFFPYIHAQNYVVGKEFLRYFSEYSKNIFIQNNGELIFDLKLCAIEQLQCSFHNIKINDSFAECTFQNERLYSYRKNKTINRNRHIFTIKYEEEK